jgi:hypothetical protein
MYFSPPRSYHSMHPPPHYTLLHSPTACHTYADVIEQVQRPGSELHKGWAHLPAPEIAIAYWRLPKDAMFVDTLKCMVSNGTSSPFCHLVTPTAWLSTQQLACVAAISVVFFFKCISCTFYVLYCYFLSFCLLLSSFLCCC